MSLIAEREELLMGTRRGFDNLQSDESSLVQY